MFMSAETDIREILRRPAIPSSAGSRAAALLGGGETTAQAVVTVGELIYDRVSIDPMALEAFEFAHKPMTGDVYKLSTWAHSTLDGGRETIDGRVNRLQGYVFERFAASALRQGGAVVELPDSATNPGWDLRVNGAEVQAKCGLSPQLVREHFARHPDVPRMVVNEELAAHFVNDDRVIAIGGVTRDLVRSQTEHSLHVASDMLDLSLVQFAPALSVIRNGWALWQQETDVSGVVGNVLVDGGARYVGWIVGKAVGAAAVVALSGWPAVLAPAVSGAVGYRGGRAMAGLVKRHVLLRTETVRLDIATRAWCAGCARVLGGMVAQAAAAGVRFRAARARAGAAWTPLMDDWLRRLDAEQAYRQLHHHRFERAQTKTGVFGGGAGPQEAAVAAMVAASRVGLLPSDLPVERKALVDAAGVYSRGLRRRLLA